MSGATYKWQEFYQEALAENQRSKLEGKIYIAENAISERLQELAGKNVDHHAEREAIKVALAGLRSLQVDRLNYPKLTDSTKS